MFRYLGPAVRVRCLRVGVVVVGGGVAPADEADDLAAVVDGQDEAVAEGVDEPAGGGLLGEPGGEQFLVGGAVAA